MYEWISWCQTTEDVRPTTYPTNIAIFGWLESGTGGDCLQAGRESDADDAALAAVKAAVRAYYAALDRREHGGVAQDKAFRSIEQALDMQWVQGASLTPPSEMHTAQPAK